MSVITLLTDFGVADTYVGQLKGAMLAIAPAVTIVDLTHAVEPQDVFGGAFLLWSAVEVFPPGSIHVAVVDPGVGSPRRALALRSGRGDVFVGPDNGLLLPACEKLGGITLAVELTERRYWRPNPSGTFHGRDIFGPVVGHLACGEPLENFGAIVSDLTHLTWPTPRATEGDVRQGLEGEVLHVDTYGNLVTNVPASSLPPRFRVHLREHVIPQAAYYEAVDPGSLLALVGSAGLLEISARNASAAAITGAKRGTRVGVEAL